MNKKQKIKKCVFCDKQLQRKNKYCSKECYISFQKKQREENKVIKYKNCLMCNKQFEKKGYKKFCSPDCREGYKRNTGNLNSINDIHDFELLNIIRQKAGLKSFDTLQDYIAYQNKKAELKKLVFTPLTHC